MSAFALQYDPSFRFTTITLNYNYAAAPHRDVNHHHGHARIIALGNYDGGELVIHQDSNSHEYSGYGYVLNEEDPRLVSSGSLKDGEECVVDIRNKWFDFDGRQLHSTRPFAGERYSLVYFSHVIWLHPSIPQLMSTIKDLGLPWPDTIHETDESSMKVVEEEESEVIGSDPRDRLLTLHLSECDDVNLSRYYYIVPQIHLNQQYIDFLPAEISSLITLGTGIDYLSELNAFYRRSDTITANGIADIFPVRLQQSHRSDFTSSDNIPCDDIVSLIAKRSVTFELWREVCWSPTPSTLMDRFPSDYQIPTHYHLDILSYGKKLSTREKRKLLALINFPLSEKRNPSRDSHSKTRNHSIHAEETFNATDTSRDHRDKGRHVEKKVCLLLDYRDVDNRSKFSDDQHPTTTNHLSLVVLCEKMEIFSNNREEEINRSDKDSDSQIVSQEAKGSTPLKPLLGRILCNLAKVGHGSIVYDPFCGYGSILHQAQAYGAYCIGSDVLIPFSGGIRPPTHSNESSDRFQGNIYHFLRFNRSHERIGHDLIDDSNALTSSSTCSHGDMDEDLMRSYRGLFVDCIVTDPPYGRRERHVDINNHDELAQKHATNDDRARERFEVIRPVLRLAESMLLAGGRLVFLFLNYPNSSTASWTRQDLQLDRYPCLRLVDICRETWIHHSTGHVLARDTVIIEKVSVSSM